MCNCGSTNHFRGCNSDPCLPCSERLERFLLFVIQSPQACTKGAPSTTPSQPSKASRAGSGFQVRKGRRSCHAIRLRHAYTYIQRLNLRMTLHYAWHNQPLSLQDHSCPTKALQRLTQVAHLFLKQPSVIQPENLRPVLKLVQRPFVANVLEKLTI